MMDMGTMMMLIIGAVIIAWIIMMFMGKRDRLVENPIDVHEMLLHKMKKSARRNIRGTRLRYLYMLGDDDCPAYTYSRIHGLIQSGDTIEVFIWGGRLLLSRIRWVRIPVELTRDPFGRSYCIKARGLRPKANYLIPVWTVDTVPEDRLRYERILDESFKFLVTQEKYEELHEQNVNAMIEAVNAKRVGEPVYRRDEHLVNSPEASKDAQDPAV